MICPSCNRENSQGTNFCIHCGTKMTENEEAATVSAESYREPAKNPPNQKAGQNEFVETSKKVAVNYWNFCLSSLKSPTKYSGNVDSKQFINGYITLGLFACFYALTVVMMTRIIHRYGSILGYNAFSFPKTFFPSFIYAAAFAILTPLLIWGVCKILMRVDISFHDCVARFGSYSTVYTGLMVVAFIIAIPSIGNVTFPLIMLMFISYLTAIFATVYSYKNQAVSTFDPFYGALIVYGIFLVLIALFWDEIAEYILLSVF